MREGRCDLRARGGTMADVIKGMAVTDQGRGG